MDSPIKDSSLEAGFAAALLHELGVNLFEGAGNGGHHSGADFLQCLRELVNDFDVRDRHGLEKVNVIECAAVDVSERKERNRDIVLSGEVEVATDVVGVAAEI